MNIEFLKLNKEELGNMFKERFDELATQAVLEEDPAKKIRISERALENRYWQNQLDDLDTKKKEKFTGI
jgi:hypothetical protein